MDEECRHERGAVEVAPDGASLTLVCADCLRRNTLPVGDLDAEQAIARKVADMTRNAEAARRFKALANPQPEFRSLTGDEARSIGAADKDAWLLEPILPVGAATLLVARHKVGKTQLLQNLLLSLLTGEPFLRCPEREPYERSTLYVNLDEDAKMFGRQVDLLRVPSAFRVLNLAPAELDVSQLEHTRALGAHCVEHDVGVLVLDVWGAAFKGDENDNTLVRNAMNNLLTMKAEAHLDAFIVVHHAGWGDTVRSRGASSIEGAVDVLWYYEKDAQERRIFCVPTSRIQGQPDTVVSWSVFTGKVGVEKSKSAQYDDALVGAVATSTQPSVAQLVLLRVTNESDKETTERLRRLVNEGRLVRVVKAGNSIHYALPPAG